MRILLDTHVYIWAIAGHKKLSNTAKSLILNADKVYVSSASIWEIGIKVGLGKLDLDLNLAIRSIDDSGFLNLPITVEHVFAATQLPNLHNDPFDRVLIGQAISEPLTLLTVDKKLEGYCDLVKLV